MKLPKLPFSSLNLLLIAPMAVMAVHLADYYQTDNIIVRWTLAISFDLIAVVLFNYLTNGKQMRKSPRFKKGVLTGITLVLVYQLFINIRAYWMTDGIEAILKGGIFPVLVAVLAYLAAIHSDIIQAEEAKKAPAVPITPNQAPEVTPLDDINRQKCWEMTDSGIHYSEILKTLNISKTTYYRWIKQRHNGLSKV